ncbi:MAG TPA: D-alanine--D-alanine ligase A, partial [Anaerolineales bacterium]|nr:D-alanine--D-alanine ligase A [Anaerolineales bacterium]
MTTSPTSRKLRIAVLFGGRSGEHDVSLMSARSVVSVLDPQRYEVTQVGLTLDGNWLTGTNTLEAFEKGETKNLVRVIPPTDPASCQQLFVLRSAEKLEPLAEIDVFFPVLHGPFGEDGTLQGLFEMANVAYVGAGVAG